MADAFDDFFGPSAEASTVQEPSPASESSTPPSGAREPSPQMEPQESAPAPTPAEPTGQGRATTVEKLSKPPPDDMKPEETAKEVYLVYGEKNDGKTYAALSFPGKILALSFDYKTAIVKKKSFNNDARITVYDALIKEQYGSPDEELASAPVTLKYIHEVLDNAKADPPDWILIDGSEIFQKVAENAMRFNNSIGAFAGVQWTFWKERRFYIRQLHEKAIRIARRGVIYTTYVDKDEIVVEGQIKARTDCPKWVDAVLYSVDEVLRVKATTVGTERRYIAKVDGSKLRPKNSGREFDITGKGVASIIG